jgi:hypothetical protein
VKEQEMSGQTEPFTVMNADWKVSEVSAGVFVLSTHDGAYALGPILGEKLAGALAVISELDRHLHEGR